MFTNLFGLRKPTEKHNCTKCRYRDKGGSAVFIRWGEPVNNQPYAIPNFCSIKKGKFVTEKEHCFRYISDNTFEEFVLLHFKKNWKWWGTSLILIIIAVLGVIK